MHLDRPTFSVQPTTSTPIFDVWHMGSSKGYILSAPCPTQTPNTKKKMPFTPSTHADSVAKAIKAKLSPGGCLACKAKKQSCSGPPHCGLCLRRGHACLFKACALKGDVVDLQATIPRVLRLSKMMDTVHVSPTPVCMKRSIASVLTGNLYIVSEG